MASSENPTNEGVRSGLVENLPERDASDNPIQIDRAEKLLEALRDFVIPLVNTFGVQTDTIRSPEAGKLVSALEEYISSVIHPYPTYNPDGIEVDLEGNYSAVQLHNKSSDVAEMQATPASSGPFDKHGEDTKVVQGKSATLNRILTELRHRIFNKMPIRLLHIVPHGSKLHIRLLDRNQICDQLSRQIETEYSDSKFNWKAARERATSGETQQATLEANVIRDWVSAYASYAILSHTWIRVPGGEVSYGDYFKGESLAHKAGYQKLVNFCKTAYTNHKICLAWMDTICINTESSSELDESIRSMHRWYRNSAVCVTYLAGTIELSRMHQDAWFTRGWTLQELLAPDVIRFYNSEWKPFNQSVVNDKDERNIQAQLKRAMMITPDELDVPRNMPISRVMQLAANREVMREEDTAYSLMGICNVSISIAYGEGLKQAFNRLLTAILSTSGQVLDIFNCAQNMYSLLPQGPWSYSRRSTKLRGLNRRQPMEPLLLTHLGLRIPVLLMPSIQADDPNFKDEPVGDYSGTVHFPKPWYSRYTGPYRLLDKGASISPTEDITWRTTFGVINFGLGNTKTTLEVPNICLATNFQSHWNAEWEPAAPSIKRVDTREPITFTLVNKRCSTDFHSIDRDKLRDHGMVSVTMYL